MTTGLGSIADIFSAGSDLAFSTVFSPMASGEVNITGAQSFTDTILNDLSYWGGIFGSTALGNNIAPVLDPNLAFAGATTVVPGTPVLDVAGNLIAPSVDLSSALKTGGQNAADFQAASPSILGTYNASYGGAGTPSSSSTLILWVLLAAGGLVVFDLLKK